MTDDAARQALEEAMARARAGDLAHAERLCRDVLIGEPAHVDALRMLAHLASRQGRPGEALQWLAQAAAADPRSPEAHFALARQQNALARHAEALASIDAAIALRADIPELYVVRAAALQGLGRVADSLADYDRALALRPGFAGALCNRGAALRELGRREEALAAYEAALAASPDLPEALINRAALRVELARFAEALDDCDRAAALNPAFHEAWLNRGAALSGLMRFDEAVASYSRALALVPEFAPALQSRGSVLVYQKRYDEALRDFERAYAIAPDLPFLAGNRLHARLYCARWDGLAEAAGQLAHDVRGGRQACEPLPMLALCGSAVDQLACARTWAKRVAPPSPLPLFGGGRYGHERIRVAYLSADLHEHATAYLMAEVFERHDRARFEVTAVSWGPDAPSPMRDRLRRAFEHFVDVRGVPDLDVARLLRQRETDIAVDLKGYTFDARPAILAHRPAPVQVNYLGYPGTLGAPFVDYILADEVVIPPADRRHYDEQVVYLPYSYQPNDRQRPIAERVPSRSECGLPERGFVFCSFNSNYKITPAVFDVWMRLLRQVEGSVLWLLEGSPTAAANLRQEAHARAVAPLRLVFAGETDLAGHLARHRLADLFLDTLPYNAHTTASDALWAGLPVLTCAGDAFAGRVGASLVRAAGVPELATTSLQEYESLGLRLAANPDELAAIRTRLARGRESVPLFDADRTRRQLEFAYRAMWERAERGEPPSAFAVPASE